MPAPLSLSRATISRSTDPEPLVKVSLIVRTGHATVKRGRDVLVEANVTSLVSNGARSWELTLDDGSTWTVVKEKGCGCGGGR